MRILYYFDLYVTHCNSSGIQNALVSKQRTLELKGSKQKFSALRIKTNLWFLFKFGFYILMVLRENDLYLIVMSG